MCAYETIDMLNFAGTVEKKEVFWRRVNGIQGSAKIFFHGDNKMVS